MGVFSKMNLNSAKVGAGGIYFMPGNYSVEVEAMKVVEMRAGKGDLFVLETLILESTNPKRPAGSRCNWAVKMSLDAAGPNIKELLAACIGRDPRNEDEMNAPDPDTGKPLDWDELGELAVEEPKKGADHNFKGTKLAIECFEKLRKDGDRDDPKDMLTLCRFNPA